MYRKPDVQDHFNAEKWGAIWLLTLGLLALGVAVWLCFSQKNSFAKVMATAPVAIAILQIMVGYFVHSRVDG